MIDLSCLQGPLPPAADMLFSDGVFDAMAGLLVFALILAAVAAPLLRRRYRQRVVRLMGFNQVAPRPGSVPAPGDPVAQLAEGGAGAASGGEPAAAARAGSDSAEALATLARQRERRITRATLVAWLTFALLGVWVAGIDPQADLSARLGFATVAALLALGPAMTNLPPRFTRWALVIGFAGCVAGLLLMLGLDTGTATETEAEADDLAWWETALIALAIGAGYLAMFHRSLRGQVLPVFVVMAVCLTVLLMPYGLLERHAGACLAGIDQAAEGSPLHSGLLLITTFGILAGLWLAFRVLDGLVRLIDRGWVSELSLASVVSLAVIAMALVMGHIPDVDQDRAGWWVWTPLPWLALTLGAYALALGRPPGGAAGPQLLVLRVFSKDNRRHSLLDELQARWRFVGAVHQIGGPDMVAMNVDPHESAMFLGNRIHELFLPEAITLPQLQARLHTWPDHEGRYRINEVFCFNTAWRRTVEQLMQLSDVIVLDLRELTARREGTGYEISRLARAGLLERVVALGDNSTDWAHVDTLLRAEGQDPRCLTRLDIAKHPPVEETMALLMAAAARRTPRRTKAPVLAAAA